MKKYMYKNCCRSCQGCDSKMTKSDSCEST